MDRHAPMAGGRRAGRSRRGTDSHRQRGSDVFYSIIGPEPKILAQLIGNIAQIMRVAGVDWTMCSKDGWDNSNMAMYSGDFETMGRVERLHHEASLNLKCKRIVMGECGHAFRGAMYDGPKMALLEGAADPADPCDRVLSRSAHVGKNHHRS